MVADTTSGTSTVGFGYIMAKLSAPIVGMLVLSCSLSVVTVVMAKLFPKPILYFLIGFTFAVELALIILGFVINSLALAISFIIIALFQACMLFCLWSYIRTGLKLM